MSVENRELFERLCFVAIKRMASGIVEMTNLMSNKTPVSEDYLSCLSSSISEAILDVDAVMEEEDDPGPPDSGGGQPVPIPLRRVS